MQSMVISFLITYLLIYHQKPKRRAPVSIGGRSIVVEKPQRSRIVSFSPDRVRLRSRSPAFAALASIFENPSVKNLSTPPLLAKKIYPISDASDPNNPASRSTTIALLSTSFEQLPREGTCYSYGQQSRWRRGGNSHKKQHSGSHSAPGVVSLISSWCQGPTVAFVTCDDDDKIESIKKLEGKYVRLDASPSGVNVILSSLEDDVRDLLVEPSSNGTPTDSAPKSIYSSKGVSMGDVIPLADADVQTFGAKAASCGSLASLAVVSAKVYSDHGCLGSLRAVLSRRVAGVPQKAASMAVLVQEMFSLDLSFVLHTVSPIDNLSHPTQWWN